MLKCPKIFVRKKRHPRHLAQQKPQNDIQKPSRRLYFSITKTASSHKSFVKNDVRGFLLILPLFIYIDFVIFIFLSLQKSKKSRTVSK